MAALAGQPPSCVSVRRGRTAFCTASARVWASTSCARPSTRLTRNTRSSVSCSCCFLPCSLLLVSSCFPFRVRVLMRGTCAAVVCRCQVAGVRLSLFHSGSSHCGSIEPLTTAGPPLLIPTLQHMNLLTALAALPPTTAAASDPATQYAQLTPAHRQRLVNNSDPFCLVCLIE